MTSKWHQPIKRFIFKKQCALIKNDINVYIMNEQRKRFIIPKKASSFKIANQTLWNSVKVHTLQNITIYSYFWKRQIWKKCHFIIDLSDFLNVLDTRYMYWIRYKRQFPWILIKIHFKMYWIYMFQKIQDM